MADAAADSVKLEFLKTNYRRRVAAGTMSRAELEAISAEATARLFDGTTVIEVTIEGGGTRATTNCDPSIVGTAAEAILAETDPANTNANTDPRNIYADFSGGRIET